MPSSLASKIQPGSENGSRVSVASIGFHHAGCGRRRIFRTTSMGRKPNKSDELRVTSVLKEELKMFGIQPELADRRANIVGDRCWRGRARPSVAATRMLELQMAA